MRFFCPFILAVALVATPAFAQSDALTPILDRADGLEPLEAVMVARDGVVIAERGYDGVSVDDPTNIKSASKTVISALVGIAIDKGLLTGVDQPIAPILRDDVPEEADPRIETITVGNLLSMQAGWRRPLGRITGAGWRAGTGCGRR